MSYFKDAENLYKTFVRKKNKLNDDLEKARKSGDFSARKLAEMSADVTAAIEQEREILSGQYEVLRQKYEDSLWSARDFTELSPEKASVLGSVSRLLKSGIDFKPVEFEHMARKYGNNAAVSRLLHDAAREKGLILDNVTDMDAKMEKFAWMCDRFERAADMDDDLKRAFLLDFTAEEVEKKLENVSFACSPVPGVGDIVGVAKQHARERVMSVGGGGVSPAGFVAGLLGEDRAEQLEKIHQLANDEEKLRFDSLSAGEQLMTTTLQRLGGEYSNLSAAMDKVQEVIGEIKAVNNDNSST